MYLEMFTIKKRGGWEVVASSDNGRFAAGASLDFVRGMHGHVPRHQLSPDQLALVEWFDEYRKSEGKIGTVIG